MPEPNPGSLPLGGSLAWLPWTIALRFLRHRRSLLLDGTARAALLATALGVMALVITMALMTGYRQDLEAKLLAGNAAILAYPAIAADGSLLDDDRRRALAAIPGVVRVTEVAYGQGALTATAERGGRSLEVTVRGVVPSPGPLGAESGELARDAAGLPGAVLGEGLAQSLGLAPGDLARLVVLGFSAGQPRFRYATVRVVRTFTTGFAEFDQRWMLLDRDETRRLTGAVGATDVVEIAVADLATTATTATAVRAVLRELFVVTDARELNRDLFAALALQKVILFLVLGLIVGVSTFNTASTLVVLVRERMRDVGVLATLGLPPRALRSVFLLYGGLLGALGTICGVVVGAGACWALTRYRLIRFDPEVADIYFLSSVPFRVEWGDVGAVVAFTLTVTFLACLLPAHLAARVDPASALRYE